ncbi:hypothetical protein CEXT_417121 [Caerostris extrusa]|uniref:Uncharacterized protein n=1 Tax=Caerostris extrusa TaxID=172846 RepID=A0AAV4U3C6_CAEEX|nr:hypothetical protein CEXT_417121 [Caerostris extrusa]
MICVEGLLTIIFCVFHNFILLIIDFFSTKLSPPPVMEPNTPNMDEILEELLPQENFLKNCQKAAEEIMEVALKYYQSIVNLTDKKGITIDMRTEFRNNALSLVNLITKQSARIAKLNGRLLEREEMATTTQTINKKPSFSDIVKSKEIKRSKSQSREIKKKFITTIKPLEKRKLSQNQGAGSSKNRSSKN